MVAPTLGEMGLEAGPVAVRVRFVVVDALLDVGEDAGLHDGHLHRGKRADRIVGLDGEVELVRAAVIERIGGARLRERQVLESSKTYLPGLGGGRVETGANGGVDEVVKTWKAGSTPHRSDVSGASGE